MANTESDPEELKKEIEQKLKSRRRKFLRDLYPIISRNEHQLSRIQEQYPEGEMENVLVECVLMSDDYNDDLDVDDDDATVFNPLHYIDFVARSGYRDQPVLDRDTGDYVTKRVTPLHHAAESQSYYRDQVVKALFRIYDRYDVNYRDMKGLSHLHVACRCGCAVEVEKFIEAGQDLNLLAKETGFPPLIYALEHHHKDVVELLLSGGADPNLVNGQGLTPLHIICQEFDGDCEMVEMLLEVCRDKYQLQIDARDRSGNTALHVATSLGRAKCVELLLRYGANPYLLDAKGLTSLHIAGKKRAPSSHDEGFMPKVLFEHCSERYRPIQADIGDGSGSSPLQSALIWGNLKFVDYLLRNGADPNFTNKEGLTPLHIICEKVYDSDLTRMFFEIVDQVGLELKIDARDKLGLSPLHYAVAHGCKENIVRELLRRGADPHLTSEDGSTPLHVICRNMLVGKLCELFLDTCKEMRKPVCVNVKDRLGWTPLHYALLRDHGLTAGLLLRHGADPNATNEAGSTMLHMACGPYNSPRLVQMFFRVTDSGSRNVRINARDSDGNTALHLALRHARSKRDNFFADNQADSDEEDEDEPVMVGPAWRKIPTETTVAEMLLRRSASASLANDRGWTPLRYAVCNVLSDIVDALLDRGADFRSFVFPGADELAAWLRRKRSEHEYSHKLRLIAETLRVAERLQRRGYRMIRDDVRAIVRMLRGHRLCDDWDEADEHWLGFPEFVFQAHMHEIGDTRLSLLLKARSLGQPVKVTYAHCLEFARANTFQKLAPGPAKACFLLLRDMMYATFFRDWIVDCLWLMMPLTVECCEQLVKFLNDRDVQNLCLAVL